MTDTNLVTIDTNNYEAMAKAMGIANEGSSKNEKKTQQLPRFRISHTPIMGETEVKGKSVNVEVVSGGTYKLEIPDNDTYYSKTATIRPFMQRYMYKRFVKNINAKMGEPMGIYHKTVMADTLNQDLKDNQGGFNCGKPAGYIEDFKSLPTETQDLIKQIKRVRVIFGLVDLEEPCNAKGDSVDFKTTPFIWEIDNRDAFKTVGNNFTKLAQMKRLPVQHHISLSTEERKLPNGSVFYLPVSSLDVSKTVSLTDEDQVIFGDFMSWIQNYNQYIVNEWSTNASQKSVDSDMSQIVDDIVTDDNAFIDVEAK
tara:strand:+ start:650 stop:1582 length:933 start_codon:yes stop_codon:yes gene_type:complete